jgi:hypothetical protein
MKNLSKKRNISQKKSMNLVKIVLVMCLSTQQIQKNGIILNLITKEKFQNEKDTEKSVIHFKFILE